MEYLPQDPNDLELKIVDKTEKKLKEFREYIVDKGVVLSFVKVLLSLKYAENKPKNPIKAIREFFGKYHDTRWDEMETLKEEIIILNAENSKLFEHIQNIEAELEILKRNNRIKKGFTSYEQDKNGMISSKQIVERFTGNKKFEVDEKLGLIEFTKLIENVTGGNLEAENLFLRAIEESNQGNFFYKSDQDNPLYKKLIIILKEMKKVGKK